MISTCLIQGGQAPNCFSRAVAEYLVYEEVRSEPSIYDIVDTDVREKLLKVEGVSTDKDLQELASEMNFLYDCGFRKRTQLLTLDDRYKLVKTVWLYHVFTRVHAELNQLRKGLWDTLQMETLAILYPKELLVCLASSTLFDVTPEFFLDTIVIKYSFLGSNNRTSEEAVIVHWSDYISECHERNKDANGVILLSNILYFMTGATKIPPGGFNNIPSIQFNNGEGLPEASTCELSMTFPRKYGLLSYEQFKDRMDFAVSNSPGFGNA